MAVVFGSPIENDAEALTGGGTYQGDGEDNNFSGLAASPVSAAPPAELRVLALSPRAATQPQQWRRRPRRQRAFEDGASDGHHHLHRSASTSSSSSSCIDEFFGTDAMGPVAMEAATTEASIARALGDDTGSEARHQHTTSSLRSAPVPPLNPFAAPSSAIGSQRRRLLVGGGGAMGTSGSIGTSNSLSDNWGGNVDGVVGVHSRGSTPGGHHPPMGGGSAAANAVSPPSTQQYNSMLADGSNSEVSRGQYNLGIAASALTAAAGSPIAVAQTLSSGTLVPSSASADQMAFSPLQASSPAGSPQLNVGRGVSLSMATALAQHTTNAEVARVISPRRHPLLCLPQDVIVAIFQYSGVSLLALRGVCRCLNDLFLLVALDHLRPYVQPSPMSWTFLKVTNNVLRKEHHRQLKQNAVLHRRLVRSMRNRIALQQQQVLLAKRNNNNNSGALSGMAHSNGGSGSGVNNRFAGREWSPPNSHYDLRSPGALPIGSGGSLQRMQRSTVVPMDAGGGMVAGLHHPYDGLAVRTEPSAVVLPAHFRDIMTRRDFSITPDPVAPQPLPSGQHFLTHRTSSEHTTMNHSIVFVPPNDAQHDNLFQQHPSGANNATTTTTTNVVSFQPTTGGSSSSSTTPPMPPSGAPLQPHHQQAASTNAIAHRHPSAMVLVNMLADDKPPSASVDKQQPQRQGRHLSGGGDVVSSINGVAQHDNLGGTNKLERAWTTSGGHQSPTQYLHAQRAAGARLQRQRVTREWLLEMALYRRVKYNICKALFDCVTIEKQSHAAPLILPNGTVCFSRWQLVAIFVRTTEKDNSTGLPLPNTSKWIKAGYLGSHSDTITSLKYDGLLRCLFTSSFDGTVKRWNLRDEQQQRSGRDTEEGGLFHCQASYKVTVNGAPAPNFHIFSMDLVHLKDYKLTAEDRKPFEVRTAASSALIASNNNNNSYHGGIAERPSSAFSFISGLDAHASSHTMHESLCDTASPSHHHHHHHGQPYPQGTSSMHPPGSSIEVLNRGSSLLCCGSEWGGVALLHIDDTHSATLGITAIADNRVRQVRFLNQMIFDDVPPPLATTESVPPTTTSGTANVGSGAESPNAQANGNGPSPSPTRAALSQQGTVMIAASTFGGLFILSHTIYRKVCEVSTDDDAAPGTAVVRARKGYHYFATTLTMTRLYVFQANELPISVDVPRSWWHRNPMEDNKAKGSPPNAAWSGQHNHITDDVTDAHPYFYKPLLLVVHRHMPCLLATINPNYEAPPFGAGDSALMHDVHRPVFERYFPAHLGYATCGRISPAHAFFAVALDSGKIVLVSPRIVPVTLRRRTYRDHLHNPIAPTSAGGQRFYYTQEEAEHGSSEGGNDGEEPDDAMDRGNYDVHAAEDAYEQQHQHRAVRRHFANNDDDDFSSDEFDTDDLADAARTVFSSDVGQASSPRRGTQHAFDFDDDAALFGSINEELQQTTAGVLPDGAADSDEQLRANLTRHQPLRRRSTGQGTSDNLESAGATPAPSAWPRRHRFDEASNSQSSRAFVWSPLSATAHLDDVRAFFGERVFSDGLIRQWQSGPPSAWDQIQMSNSTNEPNAHLLHVTTLFYPSVEHVFQPIVNMDLDGWKLSVIDGNATVMVFNVETLAHLFTLTVYPAPHHAIRQSASIERAIAIESRSRPANPKYVVWSNSTMLVSPLPITSHSVLVDFSGQFFDAPAATPHGGRGAKQGRPRAADADADVPMMPSFRPPAAVTPSVDEDDIALRHPRQVSNNNDDFTLALAMQGAVPERRVVSVDDTPSSRGERNIRATSVLLVGGATPTPNELAHTKASDSLPWLVKNLEYLASQDHPSDGGGAHRSVLSTIVPLQAHPFMFHILYIFAPPVVMLTICAMVFLMALRLDGFVGFPFIVPFALHFALLPHYFGINLYSYKPLLAHHAGPSFYLRVLADAMYLVVFPIVYVLRRDLDVFRDISWVVLTMPLSFAILLAFGAARVEDAYELRHRIALDPQAARQRYKQVTALQAVQTVFIVAFVVVFAMYFDDPLGKHSLSSMSEQWNIFVVFVPIWCFVLPYGWQIYGLVVPPAEAQSSLPRRVLLACIYVVSVLIVYVIYVTVAVLPLIGFCFRYDRYHDCALHPNGYEVATYPNSSSNGTGGVAPPPPVANGTSNATTTSPVGAIFVHVDVPCGSTSIPLTVIVVPILASLLCVSAFAASNVVTHVRQLRGTNL